MQDTGSIAGDLHFEPTVPKSSQLCNQRTLRDDGMNNSTIKGILYTTLGACSIWLAVNTSVMAEDPLQLAQSGDASQFEAELRAKSFMDHLRYQNLNDEQKQQVLDAYSSSGIDEAIKLLIRLAHKK